MNDMFDGEEGKRRRDEGMRQTSENNPDFSYNFFNYVLLLPSGWVGQCEDIREVWPHPLPKAPQSWGACWNSMIRLGLLIDTGIEAPMKSKKSNARRTHLYRRA